VKAFAYVNAANEKDALASLGTERNQVLAIGGGMDLLGMMKDYIVQPDRLVNVKRLDATISRTPDGGLRIGSAVRLVELIEHADARRMYPALVELAEQVGTPQIRNAGTIGGNLGTASPAGDTLPVLSALDATIVVASSKARRSLSIDELVVGPKRTTLAPGEIIVEIRLPAGLGSQEFLKVGTRNAMVIAVANAAVVVDWIGRSVRCALGSVGPVILRAREAEELVASRINWEERTLGAGAAEEFGRLAREAAQPIDDHRSTAAYRRHAAGVCARRALERIIAGQGSESSGDVQWAS